MKKAFVTLLLAGIIGLTPTLTHAFSNDIAHFNIHYGQKQLDDDWGNLKEQPQGGIDVDISVVSLFNVAVGYYFSEEDHATKVGSIRTTSTAASRELRLGLRKYKDLFFGRLAVIVGIGLATIETESKQTSNILGTVDQKETVSSTGYYGELGVVGKPFKRFHVGAKAVYTYADEETIQGSKLKPGGLSITGFVGINI